MEHDNERREHVRRQEDWVTSASLAASVSTHGEAIEELAEVLLGPRQTELQGGGRDEGQGLVAQFDELRTEVREGQDEIKAKLDNGIKRRITQLLVAVITTMGTVVVAFISTH